jgi:hypothetical protein
VGYRYTPRHALQSRFAENDADLYVHFPIAVASLRARLGAGRGIRADYRMEGIDMIPIGTTVAQRDLRGDECTEATHVVRAIHRGAFAVAAASRIQLDAGGSLFDASARKKLGVFDGDGFQEACDDALRKGARATGCDEPLRIELQPIQTETVATHASAVPAPTMELATFGAPLAPNPRAVATVAVARPVTPRLEKPPRTWPPSARARAVCAEEMVRIEGGTFAMGYEDESKPQRTVTLTPYCLDRTEVTVAAYAMCAACRLPSAGAYCNRPGIGKDDHPQNCISRDDAVAYCGWRGKRLPTDAEWEFAGQRGVELQPWPWGYPEATRTATWPTSRDDYLGFRCAS